METRAIVITYVGEEASEYVLTHIIESLIGDGVVNKTCPPKAYRMDSCDIAKALVNSVPKAGSQVSEADQAAIYLGEKFKTSLEARNYTKFAVELTADILSGTEETKNAVLILSQPTIHLSKKTVSEYHLYPTALTVIRNAYSYV